VRSRGPRSPGTVDGSRGTDSRAAELPPHKDNVGAGPQQGRQRESNTLNSPLDAIRPPQRRVCGVHVGCVGASGRGYYATGLRTDVPGRLLGDKAVLHVLKVCVACRVGAADASTNLCSPRPVTADSAPIGLSEVVTRISRRVQATAPLPAGHFYDCADLDRWVYSRLQVGIT
jgi:hypothetical protein